MFIKIFKDLFFKIKLYGNMWVPLLFFLSCYNFYGSMEYDSIYSHSVDHASQFKQESW